MKITIYLIFIFITTSIIAQPIDTTDIFEISEEGNLRLKPTIEKELLLTIEPMVQKRLSTFKLSVKPEDIILRDSKELIDDVYHFTEDTIRINVFVEEFQNSKYSAATTTMGMNWIGNYNLEAYDKLLNRYYKKALSVLQPEIKKKFIESQRTWLTYYLKEKSFIYELNDFGNHNSSLYCWGYYSTILESRVLFIRDIYMGNFNGSKTYKN